MLFHSIMHAGTGHMDKPHEHDRKAPTLMLRHGSYSQWGRKLRNCKPTHTIVYTVHTGKHMVSLLWCWACWICSGHVFNYGSTKAIIWAAKPLSTGGKMWFLLFFLLFFSFASLPSHLLPPPHLPLPILLISLFLLFFVFFSCCFISSFAITLWSVGQFEAH